MTSTLHHALLPVRDGFRYYQSQDALDHRRKTGLIATPDPLSQCHATVPADLRVALSQFRWSTDKRGYIKRRETRAENLNTATKHRSLIYLHQAIMGKAPAGLVWTFLDRDARNCTRENLVAVPQGYIRVRGNARLDNEIGVKGVRLRDGKYLAHLGKSHVQYHLGTFPTLEGAVYARACAEIDHYGDLASPEALEIVANGVRL